MENDRNFQNVTNMVENNLKPMPMNILGCRCKNCSNTPSATGTQQQSSGALVEVEEEEILYDYSLRTCW